MAQSGMNYYNCVVRISVVGSIITVLLIYCTTNWFSKFTFKTENHRQINVILSDDVKRSTASIAKTSSIAPSTDSAHPSEDNGIAINSDDEIVILYWKHPNFPAPIKQWADQGSACVPNCKIVDDRRYLNVSDAVLFNSADLRMEGKSNMPSVRPPYQSWVFVQGESPAHTYLDLTQFSNVFNWTMTYRRDSDISMTYGSIQRVLDTSHFLPTPANDKLVIQNKTKLVAWIVSNCKTHSNRENYVSQLQNYISVDIYGNCGSYPCTRSSVDGCFPEIEKHYKFYLSFENSLCSEYITEKFFNTLKYNLVPVVYGGGDYQSIAPPHSYIDAKDFESPQTLAKYLLFLDKNPDKYLEYFKWKPKYKVLEGFGWCDVCLKRRHQRINPITKFYVNISDWWFNTEVEMIEKMDGVSVRYIPSTKMNSQSCRTGFNSSLNQSTY